MGNNTLKLLERAYRGVRFALMLDKRHTASDGRYPVAVRVTFDYRQRYILLGDRAAESEFAKAARTGKGALYERRAGWERLFDSVFSEAVTAIDAGTLSLAALGKSAGRVSEGTLGGVYREYISNLKGEGKVTTAKLYESVLSKIEGYFGEVSASSVGVDFVKRFSAKMSEEGLSETTRGIYLRNLRAVCNYAIYKGVMRQDSYPFNSGRYDRNRIRIPKGETRAESYLGIEDMRKLYNYRGAEERWVLYFLFSYLANGANLIDVLNLRFDEHYYRSGGTELSFIRRKTRTTTDRTIRIQVPVTEWLGDVMGRLGIRERRGAYLFTELRWCSTSEDEARIVRQANKNIRKHLRRACEELGIRDGVSMTWARHSYKTNLIRQRVPDWYCEQMMGHSDGGVGAHYVGAFTQEDRMRYNSMLL